MRIFVVHRRIRIHSDIFSFQVTTIPAFVNNIHPSANIHRIVWISLIVSCVIYLAIGLAGAGAFNTPPNSTILAVISARRPSIIALISIYAFPVGWFRSFCLVVVSWIDSVTSRVDHLHSCVYDCHPVQPPPREHLLDALGDILVLDCALDHRHSIPDKCV